LLENNNISVSSVRELFESIGNHTIISFIKETIFINSCKFVDFSFIQLLTDPHYPPFSWHGTDYTVLICH